MESNTRTMPRKLPTFIFKGQEWVIDERLAEFRYIVYGELPRFVQFESEEGYEMLEALSHSKK